LKGTQDLNEPIEIPTEGYTINEHSASVLEEKTPIFSKMIYISFNGIIHNDKLKVSIAKQLSDNMKDICKLKNASRLKVYRVRIGPRTVSIEIGIQGVNEGAKEEGAKEEGAKEEGAKEEGAKEEGAKEEGAKEEGAKEEGAKEEGAKEVITGGGEANELSDEEIKNNIVQAIVDKSINKKLIIIELDAVKDIYFDGISKYDELKDMPSQVKRVLLEMNGNYPEKESGRIEFENKIMTDIISILEEPSLNVDRLQLENITNITTRKGRVYVQFLLMNGVYEKKSPHEILMKLKENYNENNGTNNFTKKHDISNVIFGEPSIILDNEDVETMKTLSEEKEDTKPIDESTFRDLESDYKRVAYFGCDLTTNDIKNNSIFSYTPISSECEDTLNTYLRGY